MCRHNLWHILRTSNFIKAVYDVCKNGGISAMQYTVNILQQTIITNHTAKKKKAINTSEAKRETQDTHASCK